MGRRFEPVWAHLKNNLLVFGRPYTLSMKSPGKWLIIGGAGYIGAHVADHFLSRGHEIVIYDSLCHGLESRTQFLEKKHQMSIPFVKADVRDINSLENSFKTHQPDGVIHTAALKSVRDSIENPELYFDVNHVATKNLLGTMMEFSIKRIIFSSTAAVYGSPLDKILVEESDETIPISPYGASKLAAETEVTKFLKQRGNSGTSLRFFNVIGTASNELRDNSVDNLVPIILDSLKKKVPPVIFGTNYPTTDGTCIRDYVDVRDVAKAHFLVASHEGHLPYTLNVGTGKGHSVREVISQIIQEAGYSNVEVKEESRREGDPASLCADTSKFQEIMNENPEFTLRDSVSSLLQE